MVISFLDLAWPRCLDQDANHDCSRPMPYTSAFVKRHAYRTVGKRSCKVRPTYVSLSFMVDHTIADPFFLGSYGFTPRPPQTFVTCRVANDLIWPVKLYRIDFVVKVEFAIPTWCGVRILGFVSHEKLIQIHQNSISSCSVLRHTNHCGKSFKLGIVGQILPKFKDSWGKPRDMQWWHIFCNCPEYTVFRNTYVHIQPTISHREEAGDLWGFRAWKSCLQLKVYSRWKDIGHIPRDKTTSTFQRWTGRFMLIPPWLFAPSSNFKFFLWLPWWQGSVRGQSHQIAPIIKLTPCSGVGIVIDGQISFMFGSRSY